MVNIVVLHKHILKASTRVQTLATNIGFERATDLSVSYAELVNFTNWEQILNELIKRQIRSFSFECKFKRSLEGFHTCLKSGTCIV